MNFFEKLNPAETLSSYSLKFAKQTPIKQKQIEEIKIQSNCAEYEHRDRYG